ncbi:MAG: iron transporter FeoB [Bacteroidia bacterium]|nr:MAG: iron transporter FeoB [Bacteroidia bacterium]
MSSREEILKTAENLRWELGERFHDLTVEALYAEASRIARKTVSAAGTRPGFDFERALDRLVTGKWTGFPIMFALLGIVFWITIEGANVPSSFLASVLIDSLHPLLKETGSSFGFPWWLNGFLFDGMYLAVAWVVSVMLPPMAIFFPLFTIAEDFGYLPRVAFNLDALFRRAGAHGKQALTMAMGYGCNAAAIISTRIIDSPRERLIAILTNNFSLCNGRWPTQILMATIFIGALAPPLLSSAVSALAVVTVVVIGVAMTFIVSWGLSKTILKGQASFFSLELPPYRPPRIWQTVYTSVIDRTLIVLWRAVVWALPSGAVIWLVSNIHVGNASIAEHAIASLDPIGLLVGLNGVILLAYIIAIPANEIVIPTILMLTALVTGMTGVGSGAGVMFELESEAATAEVLRAGGWTLLTGINLMLFSLLHNPCSTTLYTIYKETGSAKWTTLSALLPLSIAFVVCFLVTQLWGLLF